MVGEQLSNYQREKNKKAYDTKSRKHKENTNRFGYKK